MFKIFLFILFFSCCFAQPVEKIIDQNYSIVPKADLRDLMLSFSSSEDGNNVEEILKQLSAVKTNNDPRQTSDIMTDMKDIKTDMADMKDKIMQMEEKMLGMVDMKDKKAEMADVYSIISNVTEKVKQQEIRIESLSSSDQQQAAKIQAIGLRGSWCAYNDGPWTKGNTVITYDGLTYKDTNMEITGTPLDFKTGNYSLKCCIIISILKFVTFQGSLLFPCLEPGG